MLRSTALLLGALVLSSAPLMGQQNVRVMRSATLRPGIHVISGFANGNVLVVEQEDGLLLVDAQSSQRVGLADSVLRTLTQAPVRRVVYSHYHEDHTAGMAHWRTQGAIAIAHRAVPDQMRKDTTITERQWHRTPAAPAAMPDQLFEDSVTIGTGRHRAIVYHVLPAHTDGDAVVFLPEANVLHTGDLVEPGASPFIDWWAGGSIDGMIRAVDRLLTIANDETLIVPGHGPVLSRAQLTEHRRMFATLREKVEEAIRTGTSHEALQAARPAQEFEALLGTPRQAYLFVEQIYQGLARRR